MRNYLVVIPAYNESGHIRAVVSAVRRHLPVIVVDDGSTDDTARRAAAAGAGVLRQPANQGKGAALRAGFREALALGFEAVLTLDGDGQHDPAEIPHFLEADARRPADLIIGRRRFDQMPWVRRLANTLGCGLFTWALGQYVPDNQSGYRLISRRLMEAVLDDPERGFEFEVDMITVCLKSRYTLAWVPIRTIYAGEASHIQPLHHALNFLRVVLATRQKMHGHLLG